MKWMKKVFGGLLLTAVLALGFANTAKADAATPKDLQGTWYTYSADGNYMVTKLENTKATFWTIDAKSKVIPNSKSVNAPKKGVFTTTDKGKTYIMQPQNNTAYWSAYMAVHGKKTKVLVSYTRMGYFAVSLPNKTKVDYSFMNNDRDYRAWIGRKNLMNVNKTATLKVNTIMTEGKKLTNLKNKKVRITSRLTQWDSNTNKERKANLITFKVGKTTYDAWVFDDALK